MSRQYVRCLQIAVVLLLVLAPLGSEHALAKKKIKVRQFVVVDLGVLDGGDYSIGYGINDNGIVAGMAKVAGVTHAVVMQETALQVLGANDATSSASDLNTSGQVVGFISVGGDDPGQRATLWQDDGETSLGTFGGRNSIAHGINNAGSVVGEAAMTDDLVTHAFSWTNGQLLDLGTLGGTFSSAMAINENGQTAGLSTTAAGQTPYGDGTHAVVWKANVPTDVGALGGTISAATGINDQGQVVGGATTEPGIEYGGRGTHAFLWQDGQMTDLGSFEGQDLSSANAINDAGEVVGFAGNPYADDPDSVMVATLWDARGTLINLNDAIPSDSGWYLVTALSINAKGQITGLGISHGQYRGFLLEPKK